MAGSKLPPENLGKDAQIFRRQTEPTESAFSLLVPQGWQIEGGIQRVDLTQQMIDAQAIQAKVDFSVKKDKPGTVMIRWCPEVKFKDVRYGNIAGAMGMFPPGSNYGGMVVWPVLPPQQFLNEIYWPWAHPRATDIQLLSQGEAPELLREVRENAFARMAPIQSEQVAGMCHWRYDEGGVQYEEKAYTVIENLGYLAGGMWSNKSTYMVRAPLGELSEQEGLLAHIHKSVRLDPLWIAREIVSQEFLAQSFLNAQYAQQWREQRMLQIQRQVQRLDQEIMEHRMNTQAEIQNDQYLNLMSLEEYVNPYTGWVETGTNQWHHRWVNANGDEFYTNDEYHDPSIWGLLNCTDWRRSMVRPRMV